MQNRRKVIFAVLLLSFVLKSKIYGEEDKKWDFYGIIGISYNQTRVSDNWSGSEENTYNWLIRGEGAAVQERSKTSWENTLKLEFGRARTQEGSEEENADDIFFESLLFWKIRKVINPYANFILDTQFVEFHDPAKYTQAVGLLAKIINKERTRFFTRAGPSIAERFDSARKEKFSFEIGAEWITTFVWQYRKILRFSSEPRFFSAFNGGPDLRWDTSVFFKLAKYLTLQVNYRVLFEFDKDDEPQKKLFKDSEKRLITLFGFSYNLFK
jgi:hypothetical protein